MSKEVILFVAKLAISACLLAYVLADIDMRQIFARVELLNVYPLIAALVCMAIQLFGIATWRWERVLKMMSKIVRRAHLVRYVAIGIFFNQVLPTTVGGDGFRILLLSKNEVSLSLAVRSVFLDRVLGLLGLLLLATVSVLCMGQIYEGAEISIITKVIVVIISALFAVLCLVYYSSRIKISEFFERYIHISKLFDFFLLRKQSLGYLLLVSVLGHLLSCLAVWLIARAFSIDAPILATLLVVPMVLLAAALPVSISGWGVREGGMIIGLGLLGVGSGDATLVSVVFGLASVLLGVVGGLTWVATGLATVQERQSV